MCWERRTNGPNGSSFSGLIERRRHRHQQTAIYIFYIATHWSNMRTVLNCRISAIRITRKTKMRKDDLNRDLFNHCVFSKRHDNHRIGKHEPTSTQNNYKKQNNFRSIRWVFNPSSFILCGRSRWFCGRRTSFELLFFLRKPQFRREPQKKLWSLSKRGNDFFFAK